MNTPIREIRYLFDKRYIKLINGEIIKEGAMFANRDGHLYSIKFHPINLQDTQVNDKLEIEFYNPI